jgi:hypothetical protein
MVLTSSLLSVVRRVLSARLGPSGRTWRWVLVAVAVPLAVACLIVTVPVDVGYYLTRTADRSRRLPAAIHWAGGIVLLVLVIGVVGLGQPRAAVTANALPTGSATAQGAALPLTFRGNATPKTGVQTAAFLLADGDYVARWTAQAKGSCGLNFSLFDLSGNGPAFLGTVVSTTTSGWQPLMQVHAGTYYVWAVTECPWTVAITAAAPADEARYALGQEDWSWMAREGDAVSQLIAIVSSPTAVRAAASQLHDAVTAEEGWITINPDAAAAFADLVHAWQTDLAAEETATSDLLYAIDHDDHVAYQDALDRLMTAYHDESGSLKQAFEANVFWDGMP